MLLNNYFKWLLPALFAFKLSIGEDDGADEADDKAGEHGSADDKGDADGKAKDAAADDAPNILQDDEALAAEVKSQLDAAAGRQSQVDDSGKPAVKEKQAAPEQTDDEKAAAEALKAAATPEAKAAAQAEVDKLATARKTADDKKRADAEIEEVKGKKVDDIKFTDEERRHLSASANKRIRELTTIGRMHEQEVARLKPLEAQINTMVEGRNAFETVMRDNSTTPDELGGLMYYNKLVKSGTREGAEAALEIVNTHRTNLLKMLGREDAGVDLLAEFPDLSKAVEDEEITRKMALEQAQLRRQAAAYEQQRTQQHEHQQTQQTRQQQEEAGLDEITKMTDALAKSDPHYREKEKILTPRIEGIIKGYSPDKWATTLKMIYDAIPAPAPRVTIPSKDKQPIRPKTTTVGAADTDDAVQALRNAGIGQRA